MCVRARSVCVECLWVWEEHMCECARVRSVRMCVRARRARVCVCVWERLTPPSGWSLSGLQARYSRPTSRWACTRLAPPHWSGSASPHTAPSAETPPPGSGTGSLRQPQLSIKHSALQQPITRQKPNSLTAAEDLVEVEALAGQELNAGALEEEEESESGSGASDRFTRDTSVSHLTDELDVWRRAAEGFGEDVEVEGFSDVPVRRRQIIWTSKPAPNHSSMSDSFRVQNTKQMTITLTC